MKKLHTTIGEKTIKVQNKQFIKYSMGNRTPSLRENKKLSREELSLNLKIFIQKIVLLENGQEPTLFDEFLHLSDFFDVTSDYIVCLTDGKKWNV